MATVGTHYILELYDCPSDLLNDAAFVQQAVHHASRHGLTTLLNQVSHKFEPHGVTVVGLLAESHLAVHTWPEHNYVAADIFTCGPTADPDRACQCLVRQFRARRHSLTRIARGSELAANRRTAEVGLTVG